MTPAFRENQMLAAARAYLAKGWSVIPLRPGTKTPGVPWKQYQERHASGEEIRAWWPPGGTNGVAIVTGRASGGLAVLDVDDVALAERMAADSVLMAETCCVRTPSGGLHLYVTETKTQSAGGPLVPGVADLKAAGGYVVAPPTPGYRWVHRGVADESS
jgi:hypothetical protein